MCPHSAPIRLMLRPFCKECHLCAILASRVCAEPLVPRRPPAELLAGQTAQALLVSHLPARAGELWKVMTEAGSSKSQGWACHFLGRANTVRLLGLLRGGGGACIS